MFRLGPRRQIGHRIDLPQQLRHQLTRIVALAELIELTEDALQGVFGLRDGQFGEVLALRFEALVVLDELFPEKRREALTGGPSQRPVDLRGFDAYQPTLGSNSRKGTPQK